MSDTNRLLAAALLQFISNSLAAAREYATSRAQLEGRDVTPEELAVLQAQDDLVRDEGARLRAEKLAVPPGTG